MAKRKPQIVDEVPQEAADMSQAGPVDAGNLAEKANAAMVPWASKSVIEFHPTLAEIAKLKVQHDELLKASDVTTEEGYKRITQALRTLTPLRTAVDKRRLEEGRAARDYTSRVNAAGNLIIERLAEIEAPLAAALKAQDEKEEREALARAQAIEAEQRAAEEQRLALLKAVEDRKKEAAEAELRARQAAINKEKEEFEKQKQAFELQQKELRDAQEKLRLEQERQQRETQARADQEQRDREHKERMEREERERADREEAAKKQAAEREEQREKDRIANEARIKEAKEKAAAAAVEAERQRVKREQEAKEEKAKKDKEAADRRTQRAPDREKITQWTLAIQACTAPQCKSKDLAGLVSVACAQIASALRPLMNTVAADNEADKRAK